jgi:hypothetical protein
MQQRPDLDLPLTTERQDTMISKWLQLLRVEQTERLQLTNQQQYG